MRPIYITRALSVAADPDGIALDQAIAGGALTLNGVLVSGGVAQIGAQRRITFTPGAGDDLTGITFTIEGTDDQGHEIGEEVAGLNATAASTVLDYATVTSVSASVAGGAGETVSVGTSAVGASAPVPVDQYGPSFNIMIAAILRSGAANFTVQYTFDDVFAKYAAYAGQLSPATPVGDPTEIVWWDHADLTAKAASSKGSLISPVKAIRLLTNSGTGEVELQIVQGSIA